MSIRKEIRRASGADYQFQAGNEASALELAWRANLPVPELLEVDWVSNTIVLSQLPGAEMGVWLKGLPRVDHEMLIVALAQTVARVHKANWEHSSLTRVNSIDRLSAIDQNLSRCEDLEPLRQCARALAISAPSEEPLVFVHGDLNPSNILVGDAYQLSLVDWEEGHVAPRERDVAQVIEPQNRICTDTLLQQSFIDEYERASNYNLRSLGFYQAVERLSRDANARLTAFRSTVEHSPSVAAIDVGCNAR